MKKKMTVKKCFSVLLAVTLVSLTGCGTSAEKGADSSGVEQETAENGEITVDASRWKECFTLGKYEGIELPKLTSEVSDEELETAVKEQLRPYAASQTVKNGQIEASDVLELVYTSKIDKRVIDRKKEVSVDLLTGSEEAFKENLIGKEIGKVQRFEYTYGEDEGDSNYRGKKVNFVAKVRSVTRYTYPEITDDFAKENLNAESKDAYYQAKKAEMEAEKQNSNSAALYQIAYDKVLHGEGAYFDRIPVSEEENIINDTLDKYNKEAADAGKPLEEYVRETFQVDYPDFLEGIKQQADETIMDRIVWDSVAEAAHISFTQGEYDQLAYEAAVNSGFESVEDFIKQNGEYLLRDQIFHNAAVTYVIEHAVLVDQEQ